MCDYQRQLQWFRGESQIWMIVCHCMCIWSWLWVKGGLREASAGIHAGGIWGHAWIMHACVYCIHLAPLSPPAAFETMTKKTIGPDVFSRPFSSLSLTHLPSNPFPSFPFRSFLLMRSLEMIVTHDSWGAARGTSWTLFASLFPFIIIKLLTDATWRGRKLCDVFTFVWRNTDISNEFHRSLLDFVCRTTGVSLPEVWQSVSVWLRCELQEEKQQQKSKHILPFWWNCVNPNHRLPVLMMIPHARKGCYRNVCSSFSIILISPEPTVTHTLNFPWSCLSCNQMKLVFICMKPFPCLTN